MKKERKLWRGESAIIKSKTKTIIIIVVIKIIIIIIRFFGCEFLI